MKFSESLTNIAAALAKVQAEIKNPIKNQVNKGVQGAPKYANLEDTLQEYVRPILTKYGMSVFQSLATDGGRVGVCTVLLHESDEEKQLIEYCKANPTYQGNAAMLLLMYTGMRVGELETMYREGDYVYCDVIIPTNSSGKEILSQGQATGVNITYLRRYSLNAALGINGDKDTDGSVTDTPLNDEPLTYETALEFVITFGKHNGATLKEIYKTDRDYINWLVNGEKTDAKIKEAINLIETEIAKGKA